MSGLKIILIGDSGVGKTCLTQWFKYQKYMPYNHGSTIGAAFMVQSLTVAHEGKTKVIKLQIWDTAGQERYRSISKMYYRDSHGCLCVFDLTDRKSFLETRKWIRDYNENNQTPHAILLVANKSDLPKSTWKVTDSEIQDLCIEHGIGCAYTSSLEGTNVNRSFEMLALAILDLDPPLFNNNKNVTIEEQKSTAVELVSRYVPSVGISQCGCQ